MSGLCRHVVTHHEICRDLAHEELRDDQPPAETEGRAEDVALTKLTPAPSKSERVREIEREREMVCIYIFFAFGLSTFYMKTLPRIIYQPKIRQNNI